jgi:hypothetical protein
MNSPPPEKAVLAEISSNASKTSEYVAIDFTLASLVFYTCAAQN